jgi:hypothetical protein
VMEQVVLLEEVTQGPAWFRAPPLLDHNSILQGDIATIRILSE